jgi:lipoprotein-anchoring transpeptidase ErfK/SrfK
VEPGESDPARRLAAAVGRLEQRSRLLLYLSVRHRIPDEELADFLDTELSVVSRERARTIERITDDLGMTSVTELAEVLAALPDLPQETWGVPVPPGLASAESNGAEPDDAPDQAPRRSRVPGRGLPRAGLAAAEALAAAWRALPAGRVAAAAVPVAALSAGAGAIVAAGEESDGEAGRAERPPGTRAGGTFNGAPRFVPQGEGAVPGAAPDPAATFTTARISKSVILRSSPRGKARVRIGPRTEFGSRRVLGVVRRRGGWVGVQAAELGNGEVGWLPKRRVELGRTTYALHADLSRRELTVIREGEVLRRMTVTVGGAETPTPTGRFAVTDRLRVNDPRSPYGCCVLALTGHQPKVPDDWPGGDRLAIHATRGSERPGRRASLGCMRAIPAQLRWLMRSVPLGSPVFVRYGPPPSQRAALSDAPFPAR